VDATPHRVDPTKASTRAPPGRYRPSARSVSPDTPTTGGAPPSGDAVENAPAARSERPAPGQRIGRSEKSCCPSANAQRYTCAPGAPHPAASVSARTSIA